MLLDTCTLLWLTSDSERLSARVREAMARQPEALRVSSISAFEIGQKAARGRLILPLPIGPWFAQVVEKHGLIELPVTGSIAGAATELPLLHRDPFDRILIATALAHGIAILTPDPLIHQYPGLEAVW